MTYMFILKCALKLVLKNILYYDARSEKHQIKQLVGFMTVSIYYNKSPSINFIIIIIYYIL